jgi:hypothetical protein
MSIVDYERSELQKQLSEEENCPETCFIEQAIDLLSERHAALSREVATSQAQSEQPELNVENIPTESKPVCIRRAVLYIYN